MTVAMASLLFGERRTRRHIIRTPPLSEPPAAFGNVCALTSLNDPARRRTTGSKNSRDDDGRSLHRHLRAECYPLLVDRYGRGRVRSYHCGVRVRRRRSVVAGATLAEWVRLWVGEPHSGDACITFASIPQHVQ